MSDIVERLAKENERRRDAGGDMLYRGPSDPLLTEAADTITALRAELAEARETIIAFAGPWAMQYAQDYGLPEDHLHPTHYDILAKAGARMDEFTRAALTAIGDHSNGRS